MQRKVWATFQRLQVLSVFWFWLTVTEWWSRWIIPSIQTAAIVLFLFVFFIKEQTYVGEWNVDHFKGMMKAQCWIVLKEAPHVWMRTWQQGWRGERKQLQTTIHLLLALSDTFYSHSVFCGQLFLSVCLLLLFEHF